MADWKEYSSKIDIKNGYAVIMFTDCFEIAEYPITDSETAEKLDKGFGTKLIDIRIFDAEKEYRVFRGDVSSKNFFFRKLDDLCSETMCDDEQFLDIDVVRTTEDYINSSKVRAVGGGFYKMPLKNIQNSNLNDIKIHIRNYVHYDEYGQAYIKDWRITDIK